MAVVAGLVGTWCGISIGRSIEGWTRPLGLAAPGWVVVLGAAVSAVMLVALAAGLACLDDIRHQPRR